MLAAAFASLVAIVAGLQPTSPAAEPAPTGEPSATQPDSKKVPISPIPSAEPDEGKSVRVRGDAKIDRPAEGVFAFGPMLINTPLPVGYPDPTPPGAIEIKRYPVVRRAEVTGRMSPGIGMNLAFFPLFQHIKSRDIAMTAPVEMNYTGTRNKTPEGGDARPESWTMSFLYRRTDQGPTGKDQKRSNVQVVDVPAITVVSLGVRGPYNYAHMQKEWQALEEWLNEQSIWEAAGEPRALHYNGPERREADLWSEVQIPIRLAAKPTMNTAAPAAEPTKQEHPEPAAAPKP